MNSVQTLKPDEAALRTDLQSVAFRAGEAEERWGVQESPETQWPFVVFWVAAPPRASSPTRFFLRLDLAGYPAQAPTGRFWEPEMNAPLVLPEYPKGTGDTGRVFRTDWPSVNPATGDSPGSALYHPFDRRPASDHGNWKTERPHQQWNSRRTVVDYLEMVYGLLNSPTYTGTR